MSLPTGKHSGQHQQSTQQVSLCAKQRMGTHAATKTRLHSTPDEDTTKVQSPHAQRHGGKTALQCDLLCETTPMTCLIETTTGGGADRLATERHSYK